MKQDLSRAVRILRAGGLVAFPTETVYGLGADAQNEGAVRRIFVVKGRPASHPVIVHLADATQLDGWARSVPAIAYELARAFWPGPFTMVLKRSELASDAITGGQDTVALRVPATPLAQQLLKAFGGGIAAPSANRYGRVSPTKAEDVRAELGDQVDAILDGGPCLIGVESTILDLSSGSPALLRPGGVPREELERIVGKRIPLGHDRGVRAPGMQPIHYAPATRIVIAEQPGLAAAAELERRKGQAVVVVAPKGFPVPEGLAHIVVPEKLDEYAQVLYRTLRDVDRQHFDVAVFWVPQATGLGLAIRDRLARAAGADLKE